MLKTCEFCRREFNAKRSRYRFCGNRCAGKAMAPKNGYQPGHRGFISATSFRKGQVAPNEKPVGTVVIRNDHGTNRAWVKLDSGWRPRAVAVWETTHGPKPRGSVIHHKNHDPLDDRIENLQCLTRAEHAKEHQDDHKTAQWGDRLCAQHGATGAEER
jgi:hypothetical protein